MQKSPFIWSSIQYHVESDKMFGKHRIVAAGDKGLLGVIIPNNSKLSTLYDRLLDEGLTCIEGDKFKLIKNLYTEMAKGTFDIAKNEESFRGLQDVVFKGLYGLVLFFDYLYIDSRAIQILFPLELLNKFIEFRYFRYGYWLYDELLKIRSVMMNILLQFHLSSDAKFHLRIDTHNIPFMDPLLRIHIRQTNRRDKVLNKKYFTSTFDLKQLTLKALDTYFPNVTWRYIGGAVYINHQIFNLVKSLFELGLWVYSDLAELLEALTAAIDNLMKLELASIFDVKNKKLDSYPNYICWLADYFQRIRYEIAEICVHIITLVNDQALENSLEWNPSNRGKTIKFEACLDSLFFNDMRKSSIVYRLLTNYLMADDRVEKNFNKEVINADRQKSTLESLEISRKKLQTIISELFEIITYENNDVFIGSSSLTTQSTFEIFTQVDKTTRECLTEAQYYRRALIKIFEELKIVDTKNKVEAKQKSETLQRVVTLLQKSIALKANSEKSELFSIALGLNNVHTILLAITILVDHYLDNPEQDWLPKDCLVMPMFTIVKITDNIACQSIMLSRSGWELFNRLVQRQPLLSVMMVERIFSRSSEIFNGRIVFFKTFIGIYSEIAKDVSLNLFPGGKLNSTFVRMDNFENKTSHEKLQLSLQINKIISMVIYNQCLFSLIKNKSSNQAANRNFDLHVQKILDSVFSIGLLKQIIMDESLIKSGDAFITGKEINFDSIPELIRFSKQEQFDSSQIRCLLYHFAVSTLKLFTKCTTRLIYGHVHDNLSSAVQTGKVNQSFDHHSNLESGLVVRKHILQLITNFFIFKSNTLVCRTLDDETTLIQHFSPTQGFFQSEEEHKNILTILESEFNFLDEWAKQHYSSTSSVIKQTISDYLYEGLLPTIYKFTKGHLCLLTFSYSDSVASKALILELHKTFTEIDKKFDDFCDQLKSKYGISIYKSQVDGLLSMLKMNMDNEDNMPLANSSGSGEQQKSFALEADHTFEEDEALIPQLHSLRGILRKLIRTIEESCPPDKKGFIERYDRPTALKKLKSKLEGVFGSGHRRTRVRTEQKKLNEKAEEVKKRVEDRSDSMFEHFKAVCEAYIIKKRIWLNKDRQGNNFYKYLDNNVEGSKYFMDYWMGFVKNHFVPEVDPLAIHFSAPSKEILKFLFVRKLIEDDATMSLITFFDTIYRMAPASKKEFFTNFEQFADRVLLIKVMMTSYLELGRFLFYKTFHDDVHHGLISYHERINEVFINFADNDNTVFKDHIATADVFRNVPMLSCINNQLHRMLDVTETVYYKRNHFLLMVEQPESMSLIMSEFRLMGEICSGPSMVSQAAIYNFSADMFTAPMHRIIDDVNSPYYLLKYESINYYSALIEDLETAVDFNKPVKDSRTAQMRTFKEMKDVIKQNVANNIRPHDMEHQIYRMLKKLFIYVLLNYDPAFKAEIISSIKSDLETQRAELKARLERAQASFQQKNANTSKAEDLYDCHANGKFQLEQEIMTVEQKISKLLLMDESISLYEDRDAIILTDMERKVRLTSPWKLIQYYKQYPLFSDHLLLKMCIQLQFFLTNLSKSSEQYQTVVQSRMNQLYAYYGNKVPDEIREGIHVASITRLKEEDAPEKVVIFQFLALITKTIDVQLNSANKVLHFQLHPNCMFLTRETRVNFMDRMNPDEVCQFVMDNYKTLAIEMETNRRQFIRSKTLYYLTLHDSLTTQKYFLWYLSVIMNIMLVVSYKTDNFGQKYYAYFGELTFVIFSLVIGGLSILVLTFWSLSRYKQILNIKLLRLTKKVGLKNFTLMDYYNIYVGETIIKKKTPAQCVLHVVFSLLGALVHPFFHTLHLPLIALLSDTAGYVIKAITTHFRQLSVTLLMAIFFIYSFAFLVFINYQQSWDEQVDNNGTIPMCRDLWDCVFYVVNMGLRNGGGIADSQGAMGTDDFWPFVAKTVFDVLFFILINVISLNIIFGIIIDTFADMRDKREERSRGFESKCVICNQSREILERNNEDETFGFHVNFKHNLWKYVYYQVYLESKDPTELTGAENFLRDHVMIKRSENWFPKPQFEDEAIRIEQLKITGQLGKIIEMLGKAETERADIKKQMKDEKKPETTPA